MVQHTDPDRLALVALGEPLDGDAAEVTVHLGRCEQCRQEVDALRRTVDLARETVEYRTDEARPPEQVWSRIAAELDLPASAAAGGQRDQGVGGRPAPEGEGEAGGRMPVPRTLGSPDVVRGARGSGSGRHTDRRRTSGRHAAGGRRWARAAVALTAAAAVGVLGTLVAVRPWQDGSADRVVAGSAASLSPVPGGPGGASGRAVVVQGASGPELDVTATGLPPQGGYYEIWVYDGERDMVSVGVLGANATASLPLPPTLDLRRFHVVDISLEQYDGEQTHSTVSVLRGTLSS